MPLKVLFLGQPEVRWDDKIILIQRRIPRAVLFYLATRKGMVSRDEVIPIFWNQISQATAKQRLSECLSRLRSDIPDPTVIITSKGMIGLDSKKVFIDFQRFEELIDQAGRAPWQMPEDKPLSGPIHQLLRQSIELWRGPKFLACDIFPSGNEIDEWLTQTGSRLEHLRSSVLERLADHAYVIGDLKTALKRTRMALEGDELNENLHYRIMQYLIEDGHINDAHQHFEYVRDLMRREANTSPSPKLVDLYKRIHKKQSDDISQITPKWEIHPGLTVPFVGRKDMLRQIRGAFNHHRSVFILGEAGLGKTRLIQEYASQMHPKPRLLVATCRPLEKSLPFQAIKEVFRLHITPEEWAALPKIWASHLVRLIPEIQTMRSGLSSPTIPENPALAQAQLLEAIRQLFLLLCKTNPLLFVLDDAHWADEATLSTIAYLLPRPPFDSSASIAVLARLEDLTTNFNEFVSSIQQTRHGEIIYLPRLTHEDISDLSRFVLQRIPTPEFVTILKNGTGGNSLFVLETLRTILENDPHFDVSGHAPLPLAESLHIQIRNRLNKLDPSTRMVIESAAVVGPIFDIKILCDVTQRAQVEVVQALDKLENDNIIEVRSTSSPQPEYRFIHDKFREALRLDLSPAKSQFLHGRVAKALELKYQPEQAPVLAHHFESAGDWVSAFQYWVDAGMRARNLFSIRDSSRSFENAENLIDLIESKLSSDAIYNLYANWSEMAYETHNTAQVQRLGENLLALGEKWNSPLFIGVAQDILSDACMMMNKFEAGLELASQAILYLEQTENTFEHIEAHIHRGVFLYMLNRLDEAIEDFEDALALSAENNSPEVIRARSNAHYQTSLLRTLGGWPERGLEHAQQSLDDAKTSNRTYLQVSAYFVLGLANIYLGKYRQAEKYNQIGIDIARRTQGWRMYGYIQANASETEMALGRPENALHHAQEAIYLGKKFELNDVLALGYRQLGAIYLYLNAPNKAIPNFMHGIEAIGSHFIGVDNLFRLGMAQIKSGQLALGQQTMDFALAAFTSNGVGLGIIAVQVFQLLAHIESNEWEDARKLANQLKNEIHQHSLPIYQPQISRSLGEIALHDGQIQEAIDLLKQAVAESKGLGNIWVELDAQLSLKKALKLSGNRDDHPTKRIQEIFTGLENQIKDHTLQGLFQEFRQQYLGNAV
jgi:DNA-binding SARP family transcriptional activator/tetratricopeptide (TPR) repeat protein